MMGRVAVPWRFTDAVQLRLAKIPRIHRFTSRNIFVIPCDGIPTTRKFQTETSVVSNQFFYVVLVLTVPSMSCDVRACTTAGNRPKNTTYNEVQVTRYKTCLIRAFRTTEKKTAHNVTTYDSQECTRQGCRFAVLHLPRLGGCEHVISWRARRFGLTDYCSSKCDVSSKAMGAFISTGSTGFCRESNLLNISRDRQVVQFHDFWNRLESPLEVGNLQSHPTVRQIFSIFVSESPTFLKWSPNLTTGMVSNMRASFKTS